MLGLRSISLWVFGGCCRVPGLVTACRFGMPDLTRGSGGAWPESGLGERSRRSRTPRRRHGSGRFGTAGDEFYRRESVKKKEGESKELQLVMVV